MMVNIFNKMELQEIKFDQDRLRRDRYQYNQDLSQLNINTNKNFDDFTKYLTSELQRCLRQTQT